MEANCHIFFVPRGPTPTPGDFVVRRCAEPRAGAGEVIVETMFLSIDPYMLRAIFGRGRRRFEPGEPMRGRTIGRVVQSAHAAFPEGSVVLAEGPWQGRTACPIAGLEIIAGPDERELAGHLGALGQSGLTAWVGMRHLAPPAAGAKVVVSSAAGAVGGIAGQIARIMGATAVGIAGTAGKCAYVRERLGFDDCLDYRAADFRDRVRAMDGSVDLFFDNVGGEMLDLMLAVMADGGRVLVCGQIADYSGAPPYGMRNLGQVLERRLGLTGFGVSQFADLRATATSDLVRWHRAGELVFDMNVVDGLENAPAALFGLLDSPAVGKTVVRV